MPAKYSHVKKAAAAGALKKSSHAKSGQTRSGVPPNPHADRSISKAMTAVSKLERAIARILLIRYEQDIARLFSTRLYSIALVHLPTFVMRCVALGGPGWVAYNADADEVKDFFRSVISMDMRQAGERVATKSVLWSYTALRHFALSNNIPICKRRGLHSMHLLPHYDGLKTHLDALEAFPPPSFCKPPHLGSLKEGQDALEEACELKYTQTLWRVAREFDVHGYGVVLREKLTHKWCDCGCSTDHLGEVCERTVREDEEESGVRPGKQREWDGRGSGVFGWETEEEEDVWELGLDFGGVEPEDCFDGPESDMSVGELMEWRYIKAERQKEEGNTAFRKGDYVAAVKHYEAAYEIEPELPHYQLNLAAAHLKLSNWMAAEAACSKALSQHHSCKGYFRRARARKMLGRHDEAIRGSSLSSHSVCDSLTILLQDLRAIIKLQPNNSEAIQELISLLPPPSRAQRSSAKSPESSQSSAAAAELYDRLGVGKHKPAKPLPFPRTLLDDRKLKVVTVPMPATDTPLGFCHHQHSHTCSGHHHHSARDKGKGKSTSINPAAAGMGTATRREKEQALETEMLKVLEAMKVDGMTTVLVPSWDRYVIRRAEF
ncbi:unnamed protein product [Mycena citricolor]|uniref:Uncharacterized protein n=1 Tax=Mycena citricolor TaxID=2018698 RepID=A0AAD2Q132_9AGAR|nr:unnamed protein product [Mycena citricolor]